MKYIKQDAVAFKRIVALMEADKDGRVVVYDTREEAKEALRRAENGNQ